MLWEKAVGSLRGRDIFKTLKERKLARWSNLQANGMRVDGIVSPHGSMRQGSNLAFLQADSLPSDLAEQAPIHVSRLGKQMCMHAYEVASTVSDSL